AHRTGFSGNAVLLEYRASARRLLQPHLTMRVERLDTPPRRLFAFPEVVVEAAFEPVALRLQRGFVRDGDLLRVRQLVEQEVRDLAARIRAAAPPLRRQRRDRLVDGRPRLRPDLAERLEQLHPLFEADGEGVELAHHLEVLIEGSVPLEAVVLIADAVDERHPGPSGPAQG